ncbi:MAG: hypothetical protein NTU88_01185, partial [Armatimonadetes bacterium]|nr:hypothetical protein [Armatimonadota bacterium]
MAIRRSCCVIAVLLCTIGVMMMPIPSGAQASGERAEPEPWISDIAVNPDGSLFVLDTGRDIVFLVSSEGKVVRQHPIGMEDGSGSQSCRIIRASKSPGCLYVVSNRAGIRNLAEDGKLTPIRPSRGAYTDRVPSVDSSGVFYFPDKENNRIAVYGCAMDKPGSDTGEQSGNTMVLADGTPDLPCKVIDGNAEGAAHLGHPHRVDVDGLGNIWVLDQSYVYKVFDATGIFIRAVKAPDAKNRSFTYVTDLESDPLGYTYIGCQETKLVLKYDKAGKLVKSIQTGWRRVDAMGIGSDGLIYVGSEEHNEQEGAH